ncbi:hypothetical protein BHE97_04750 [Aeromicrobium sp. PE09-221]|uniref:acyl-CoA thioesterase n=1 Tax=Aeromicrobium sp. PE09-221 TaxID=1898043 RepID=UPI000B3EBCAE|nr:acyl-CoA thioesterase [Aeromicrobium sp. PE09-221]OUZ11165.1 hypothetical protein BHE97_04750 [Aeromicrobium sp. PE09-221]
MTASRARDRFTFPERYESWWSTSYEVPPSSIDAYGHMTAVHYPTVFEQAATLLLIDIIGPDLPDYVMAALDVSYRHEVLLESSPLRLYLRPTIIGTTTCTLEIVLTDSKGTPCAVAHIRYVAWDRTARTKAPLSESDRAALEGLRETFR